MDRKFPAVSRLATASIAAALLATGCGGGEKKIVIVDAQKTAPASTAPTKAEFGQRYLELVAPLNAAIDTLRNRTKGYNDSTPASRIRADAALATAALEHFDNAILRADWPSAVKADVRALVRTDAALQSDLEQIADTDDWTQLTRDAEASSSAANVVRADLGLPPPK
jgi:hypothetical protein